MWAAIKSDLREFATGAAVETNVVAERVVGTRIIRTSGEDENEGDDDDDVVGSGAGIVVPGAAVLSSLGERGLRGLTSVSSMMGGIVAPHRPPVHGVGYDGGGGGGGRAWTPPAPPVVVGSSLSSMLAAAVAYGDGEDEEEELGWDDDEDDDLDVAEDGPTEEAMEGGGRVPSSPGDAPVVVGASTVTNTIPTEEDDDDDDDRDALAALKSKLEIVERSRNELQIEHRRQTAELVELRSMVEEMGRQRHRSPPSGEKGQVEEEGEEVRTLRLQVEDLKSSLNEEIKLLSKEHAEVVKTILREKESLDRELNEHKRRNEELVEENRALLARLRGGDNEEMPLLRECQKQIRDLEDELTSLRASLDSASMELIAVKDDAPNQEEVNLEKIEEWSRRADERTELEMSKLEYEEVLRKSSLPPDTIAAATSAPTVSSGEATPKDNDVAMPPHTANGPSTASLHENSDAHEEGMASSPSSRGSGISPPIKLEVDDELSDDWGDGGWGDDA
ncbi:hypothetical protein ACHAXA_009071 [Cyclostephanos tholiformis]|uniref:Uncharacterized protein n=1 Tax=Cyclostephanos tholiformis TaxID=382380 RepID=A0ABD3SQI7_9STRA